ncbi:MAG: DUF4173 domain-containing protein [Devosia sp.]
MTETTSAADGGIWSRRTLALGFTATVLVVLGDLLFWPHEPGINLPLFGLAIGVALLALNPDRIKEREVRVAALVAVVALLPAIEAPTFTGFLWGLFGVSLLTLALSDRLPKLYEDLPGALARFGVVAPFRLMADGLRLLGEAGDQKMGGRFLRGLLAWVVPAVFAMVFVFLFVAANPLIEAGLKAIRIDWLMSLLSPERIVLWGVIALMVWPLLAPKLLNWPERLAMHGPVRPVTDGAIFGEAAIRNSLVVFNLIFLVQSAMDLLYLWGGVRLPEGMSHAEYAHRGAYPLIVTALLAAAFVLAAMRRGGAGERSPLIRVMVYLWIGQNVLLVVSSILRLELYVEEFALTELRLAAGLWMGLVALGLVLILARIALSRSNAWLVAMNLTALGVVLYGVSVVDTRAMIAWFNVQHSYELTGKGQRLDGYLMGDLGWTAMPAVDYFLAHAPTQGESVYDSLRTDGSEAQYVMPEQAGSYRDLRMMREAQAGFVLAQQDWQSWSWRGERLRQYVLAHPFAPNP